MKPTEMIITNGTKTRIIRNTLKRGAVAELEDASFCVSYVQSFVELNGWQKVSSERAEAFENARQITAKAISASLK